MIRCDKVRLEVKLGQSSSSSNFHGGPSSQRSRIGLLVGLALTSVFSAAGCRPHEDSPKLRFISVSANQLPPTTIAAQGRLLPADGIIQIAAIPGDRIEAIHVEVGESVKKGDVLVELRSEQLRRSELETLRVKLNELTKSLEAKTLEADQAIETAHLRLEQAISSELQAESQKNLIDQQMADGPESQLSSLKRQLQTLQQVRQDPLTRKMVGALEIEAKKTELQNVEATLQSSMLSAENALASARLAVKLATNAVTTAEKSKELIAASFPTSSLEKQIEAMEWQIKNSTITSPIDGKILSRYADVGELSSNLPLVEVADVTKMICSAEVHEADVGQLAIGDIATMESAGLPRTIRGRITRIDPVVGMPQLRSPNPMARNDFRAVSIVIEIDQADLPAAAERVQLQVDVTIAKAK